MLDDGYNCWGMRDAGDDNTLDCRPSWAEATSTVV